MRAMEQQRLKLSELLALKAIKDSFSKDKSSTDKIDWPLNLLRMPWDWPLLRMPWYREKSSWIEGQCPARALKRYTYRHIHIP
jgi:hypothetical protein